MWTARRRRGDARRRHQRQRGLRLPRRRPRHSCAAVCAGAAERGVAIGAQVGYRDLRRLRPARHRHGPGRARRRRALPDRRAGRLRPGGRAAAVALRQAARRALQRGRRRRRAGRRRRRRRRRATTASLPRARAAPARRCCARPRRPGCRAVAEAFADRAYTADGTLVPRARARRGARTTRRGRRAGPCAMATRRPGRRRRRQRRARCGAVAVRARRHPGRRRPGPRGARARSTPPAWRCARSRRDADAAAVRHRAGARRAGRPRTSSRFAAAGARGDAASAEVVPAPRGRCSSCWSTASRPRMSWRRSLPSTAPADARRPARPRRRGRRDVRRRRPRRGRRESRPDAEEVVRRHAAGAYACAFCGFAPGFAYLVGLDAALARAPAAEPRTRVPAGLGGHRRRVHRRLPAPSPGGWQLLGTTDAALWDVSRPEPSLIRPGTQVRFVAAR